MGSCVLGVEGAEAPCYTVDEGSLASLRFPNVLSFPGYRVYMKQHFLHPLVIEIAAVTVSEIVMLQNVGLGILVTVYSCPAPILHNLLAERK